MSERNSVINNLSDLDFAVATQKFFATAMQLGRAIAIWREPNQDIVKGVCELESIKFPYTLESSPEGFLFCPFEANPSSPKQFIAADILIRSDQSALQLNPQRPLKEESIDDFVKLFNAIQPEDFDFKAFLNFSPETNEEKTRYVDLVDLCKKSIKDGVFQKVVPARQAKVDLHEYFNPITEFLKLSLAYPHAFVSLVYLPDQGLWIGATPELLLSAAQNQHFETVSLAGTQGVPADFDLSHAAWTQKEIEEQALVSRYIVNCFKQIRLREFEEYGPKTVKAANLIHLKTVFRVDMKAVNFPELGSVMLNLLHPTSAVCGMPMAAASAFLKTHEGFDRSYFSGYLGPVNIDSHIQLYVNLRCGQIYNDGLVVFAGAGVTEDSIAENEWEETQIKFRTLLNVISQA